MTKKPNLEGLEQAEKQLEAFNEDVKKLNIDSMNNALKMDVEPQTKIAQADIDKSKDIYLKPARSIGSKEKFNEKFRDDLNYAKEYVQHVAENKEIIGETIELWTKPYPGMPAEFWQVPVNKPVWMPRYLMEQLNRCGYHKFSMQNTQITAQDGLGTYHGSMVADTVVDRISTSPVSTRKSFHMGRRAA